MVPPARPHEERVVGREQHVQPDPLDQREHIVPEPDHVGHETPGRTLDIAMLAMAIFEHQPDTGDAVIAQPEQMPLDRRDIAPAEQRREFGPRHRIVMPDRRPRGAVLGDEIGQAGPDLDAGR
jgi:hypothetical protein